MYRRMLISKLHGIRVTGAELHYEGSIALDPEQCEQAGLLPFEFVEIWNKSSGARISTYIILGEAGSRCCILNGAAARTCQVGDELIIAAHAQCSADEIANLKPRVLIFGAGNAVQSVLDYETLREASGSRRIVAVPRTTPGAPRHGT